MKQKKRILLTILLAAAGIALLWGAVGRRPKPITPENVGEVVELGRFGRGQIRDISVHPKKDVVAVAAYNGFYLYDLKNEELMHYSDRFTSDINTIDWSPDGEKYVIYTEDGKVQIWEFSSNQKLVNVCDYCFDWRGDVQWAPEGERVAVMVKGEVRMYDSRWSGPILGGILTEDDNVISFSFSPDGTKIAVTWESGSIELWDVKELTKIKGARHKYAGHYILGFDDWSPERIDIVKWSPDGEYIASGGRWNNLVIWDGETLEKVHVFDWINGVFEISWSPDGKLIAARDSLGSKLLVLKIKSWSLYEEIEDVVETGKLSWANIGNQILFRHKRGGIGIWDVDTGNVNQLFKEHFSFPISNLALSKFGNTLALGMGGENFFLWDTNNIDDYMLFEDKRDRFNSIALSPNGNRLVAGGSDGNIIVWDTHSGAEIIKIAHLNSSVLCVDWSPDGKYIASGSMDHMIRIWDANSGDLVKNLKGNMKFVGTIKWSPDGKRIASSDYNKTIIIWDFENDEHITSVGLEENYESINWSPDGRYIITGGDNFTGKILDSETLKEEFIIEKYPGTVTEITWSPDGSLIAMGNYGLIYLLDAETKTLLKTLDGHIFVRDLVWSSDGSQLVVLGYGGIIRIWGIP